jgi:hypothetical protein
VSKPKLAVVSCVHTYPEVAELSLGSFLREHSAYDVELHVGCHSNYSDYCRDLRLFHDLKGLASIHLVDEIDWLGAYNACWYRYSVMHAKNMENVFRQIRYSEFDYVVTLDHDLFVKSDFVTPLLEQFPKADLLGALFENTRELTPYETAHNEKVYRAPKVSVWHGLISRRLYEKILYSPKIIYPRLLSGNCAQPYLEAYRPQEERPIFVDTFAEVYHEVVHGKGGFSPGLVPAEWFHDRVQHFYNSSFNYGSWTRGDSYPAHIREIKDIWKREFPDGLQALRGLPQNA